MTVVVFMRNNVFVRQKLITLIIIKATNEFSCNVGIEQCDQNNSGGAFRDCSPNFATEVNMIISCGSKSI